MVSYLYPYIEDILASDTFSTLHSCVGLLWYPAHFTNETLQGWGAALGSCREPVLEWRIKQKFLNAAECLKHFCLPTHHALTQRNFLFAAEIYICTSGTV